MSKAMELYPPDTEYDGGVGFPYIYCYSYQPIVDSFGKVLVQVESQGYQGDTYAVIEKGKQFGLLVFGWGSCSGCDALQGCGSYAEVDTLIENLEAGIVWRGSLPALFSYMIDSDRDTSFYYHTEEWLPFLEKTFALVVEHIRYRMNGY